MEGRAAKSKRALLLLLTFGSLTSTIPGIVLMCACVRATKTGQLFCYAFRRNVTTCRPARERESTGNFECYSKV
jgi:hypothetical protein